MANLGCAIICGMVARGNFSFNIQSLFAKRALAISVAIVISIWSAFADDAVGIMGVSVPDGVPVPFAMPFEPLGDGRPSSFMSGPFVGDGDAAHSDVLHHFFSTAVTGVVRTATGWISPGDGMLESVHPAEPGDAFILNPSPSSESFCFRVFGRVPCAESDALERAGHVLCRLGPRFWGCSQGREQAL